MPLDQTSSPNIAAVIVSCSDYPNVGTWESLVTPACKQVHADHLRWCEAVEDGGGVAFPVRLRQDADSWHLITQALESVASHVRAFPDTLVYFVFLGIGGWVDTTGLLGTGPVLCTPETKGRDLVGAIPLRSLTSAFEHHLPNHAVTAIFDCGFVGDGTAGNIHAGQPRVVVRKQLVPFKIWAAKAQHFMKLRDCDRVISRELGALAIEPGSHKTNGSLTSALLEPHFVGVEVDPGEVFFRLFAVRRLLDDLLIGTSVVIGVQDVLSGGNTWKANTDYWIPTAGAWDWTTLTDSFKLVPIVGAALPASQTGASVRDSSAFTGNASFSASGTPGWTIKIGTSVVGWLEATNAQLTWFALDAALTGTKYLPVTANNPLVFSRSSTVPAGSNFYKLVR